MSDVVESCGCFYKGSLAEHHLVMPVLLSHSAEILGVLRQFPSLHRSHRSRSALLDRSYDEYQLIFIVRLPCGYVLTSDSETCSRCLYPASTRTVHPEPPALGRREDGNRGAVRMSRGQWLHRVACVMSHTSVAPPEAAPWNEPPRVHSPARRRPPSRSWRLAQDRATLDGSCRR